MKKFEAKQICLGVVAVGVVLCFVVYLLVFQKYSEETEALEASNAELQIQVNDMKQYYDNIPTYRQDISEMQELVSKLTEDYPGDAREEDVIMMAVHMQESTIVNFDKINIDDPEVIHSIPKDVVQGLNDETLQTDIQFKNRLATYSCETDYSGLKQLVEQVYDKNYRIAVNSVAFKNDDEETNTISGTISVSYYSIAGMNKEYKIPDMPEYAAGLSDLFPATIIDGERIIIGEE